MSTSSGISPTGGPTPAGQPPKLGLLTRLRSRVDIKAQMEGLKKLGFVKLGKGKEKLVVKKELAPSNTSTAKEAYYVPVADFLGRTKKAIKKELAKMRDIKSKGGEKTDRLALADEADEKIGGHYTLVTEEAKGDFEGAIKDKDVDIRQREGYGSDLLKGFCQLHAAGYAYGDLKPENLLVYEDGGLRIGDFGKSEEVKGDESLPYRGNLRFAPPEGRLSKKGDVYGAALTLIRNFEELLLPADGKPLVDVDPKDIDKEATKKQKDGTRSAPEGMRGIEKYIIEHKAFLGIKVKGLKDTLFKALRRYAKADKLPEDRKQRQKELIDGYIDELTAQLSKSGIDEKKASSLNHLLREMTRRDPEKRPSMERALETYNQIISLPHA